MTFATGRVELWFGGAVRCKIRKQCPCNPNANAISPRTETVLGVLLRFSTATPRGNKRSSSFKRMPKDDINYRPMLPLLEFREPQNIALELAGMNPILFYR